MALSAANEFSDLSLLPSATFPMESVVRTNLEANNADGEKRSRVYRSWRKDSHLPFSLIALTIACSLAAYLIWRCFHRASISLIWDVAPRALAAWAYDEELCSDLLGGGGDVSADKTDFAAAERGAAQAPLVVGGTQHGQRKDRFHARSGSVPDRPSLHAAGPSDPAEPIRLSSLSTSAGEQRATLLEPRLLPFSEYAQAPPQPARRGHTTGIANPSLPHEHPPTTHKPGEPRQAAPSTWEWPALGSRARASQQKPSVPRLGKWDGPEEKGWGYRKLPRRYSVMNLRALREMEAVAVTCIVLTPSLDARVAVSLAVYVSSMAALELAAGAYCPDEVQSQRGDVCDSYIALLASITASEGTLQAAREMGIVTKVESLTRLLKEIRTPPPKTETIPLEQYKIKFITQVRVGWYAFGAVKTLLNRLSPWKTQTSIPTLEPERVVIACKSMYEVLKERLKATSTLRDWLIRSQEKANSHVVFSVEEYEELGFARLQKMNQAFEAIRKAVEHAGCSPDFLPSVQAASKGTPSPPSDASEVPENSRQPSSTLPFPPCQAAHVYRFAPASLQERSSGPQSPHSIERPPQLPQDRSPHPSQSLLAEAPLFYMSSHAQAPQPPGSSVHSHIGKSAHNPRMPEKLYPTQILQHRLTPSPVLAPLRGSRQPQRGISVLPTHMPFPLSEAEALPPSAGFQLLLASAQAKSSKNLHVSPSQIPFTPSHFPLHEAACLMTEQERGGRHGHPPHPQPSLTSETAPPLRLPGVPSIWSWSPEGHQPSTPRRSDASLPPSEGAFTPSHFPLHEAPWSMAPQEQRGPHMYAPHPQPSLSSEVAPSLRLPGMSSWSWFPERHRSDTGPGPKASSAQQAFVQSGASTPAGIWRSAPARREAARTGGDQSPLNEDTSLSALQMSLSLWSMKSGKDDEQK